MSHAGDSAKDQATLQPIPDGGLGNAMPEWLRETPSWTKPAAQTRTLPPPDATEIDPAALVTVDDLPKWLQEIARRETAFGLSTPVGPISQPVIEKPTSDESESHDTLVAPQVEGEPETVVPDTSSDAPMIGKVGSVQITEGVVIFLLVVVGVIALACLILLMKLAF